MLSTAQIQSYAEELYQALRQREMVEPLSNRTPDMTVEDAYAVSSGLLERRMQRDGETVIGKKIGVTSKAVMTMLGVHQPDFGYLTDAMVVDESESLSLSTKMIQPKAEGEIAFVLKQDLIGPGVTATDVLRATDFVVPCFEIVDSRIKDWQIKIQDTVSDNASCGYFLLGSQAADPRQLDLSTVGMVVELNGQVISTGAGAAALGSSPVSCVVWLANTLGKFGVPLKAGEVILSGSLVPLQTVKPGDYMSVSIGGIGRTAVRFD
ncbi:fumarylacetoacetate hydrolase family protein [Thiothrix eikelboomii]|uniref:2-oxopent-4-enoate/cis-2-oxohex-4-enoate hydratase n=1 Tax=Thiothrix eikelboomii TaxID=92487 RepID=A0A1T4WDM1_9GAMM|nr:fumarylacetoacetate hydrolase family protein [Thiothrix eikelboomii]SKA75422.1 2-oxopent-4-enoate/cis-2-oxohex-4-enoate hydratase [Thiothrix eikelboomii]